MNIVIITSTINTIKLPLSYTNTRSIYTEEERFQQTLLTIESIKKYIPNYVIILLETSKINEIKEDTLSIEIGENGLYLNYSNDEVLLRIINGNNKSYAEGSTILKFLKSIDFKRLCSTTSKKVNLFKISGRYYLNNNSNIDEFVGNKINDLNCFRQIDNIYGNYTSTKCYYSVFYKISGININNFIDIFASNLHKLETCKDSYHMDMEHFLATYFDNENTYIISGKLGISGNNAIDGIEVCQ